MASNANVGDIGNDELPASFGPVQIFGSQTRAPDMTASLLAARMPCSIHATQPAPTPALCMAGPRLYTKTYALRPPEVPKIAYPRPTAGPERHGHDSRGPHLALVWGCRAFARHPGCGAGRLGFVP